MSIALITGGSGHVGANLVRELTAQDYKVRALILMETIELLKVMMLSWLKVSVTDMHLLDKAFEGVDVVFHTAAMISLDRKNTKSYSLCECRWNKECL